MSHAETNILSIKLKSVRRLKTPRYRRDLLSMSATAVDLRGECQLCDKGFVSSGNHEFE